MPAHQHEETERDPLAPTSRRTFLGLAAAAGGAGLTATQVVADSGDGQSVTILASPDQRDAVRDAAERLRELRPGTRISLEVAETARGIRLFTAGDVDVVAGDRPLLPAERARTSEHGVDPELAELPTDAGTISRPGSTWVDPLRPKHVAETWSGEASVSTWAEVSSKEADSGVAAPAPGESSTAVDDEASVLVRGVRAAQYASGRGGVGYYEPDREWLGSNAEPTNGDDATETDVVRLAYLGVDRSSIRSPVVGDVVQAFEAASTARVGDVSLFEDPYGVTAT